MYVSKPLGGAGGGGLFATRTLCLSPKKKSSLCALCTPPPCISYANVHNYYGPYAYCSLDKGVACAQHIQLLTHTCGGHMC